MALKGYACSLIWAASKSHESGNHIGTFFRGDRQEIACCCRVSRVFGDEKETTEFFFEAKGKYVPTTATDLLETDDESAFLDAKEVQSDSEDVEERAEKTRQKVARELNYYSERLSNGGNESDNSVKRSIAISGGKAKPAFSDDDNDDSSSEKETEKKTNVKTRKSMRDDEGFKRRLKETHV